MTILDASAVASDADFESEVRAARKQHVDREFRHHEKDWRLFPNDGGDPCFVSDEAMQREFRIRAVLAEQGQDGQLGDGAAAYRAIKYFPILFIGAPHIEDGATGAFPGIPTPMLYASCVLDRLLRIDEFPGDRTPQIVAVMNPPAYTSAFENELVAVLSEHRPVLVGISNLSEGHHFALCIARIVKDVLPETTVLLGGQHEDGVNPDVYRSASSRVEAMDGRRAAEHAAFRLPAETGERLAGLQTLAVAADRDVVDLVFAGDAQYALVEILNIVAACPAGVDQLKMALSAARDDFASLPGSGSLSFFDRTSDRIESIPLSGTAIDGNLVPFIDMSRLTQENRFAVFDFQLTAQVMACLGCKYSCSFCHESADAVLYNQPKMRQRTPGNVVKELFLRQEQNFEAVFFDDSTFTQNRRWLAEFLDLLMSHRDQLRFQWACQTTINDVDPDMLRRMAETGCTYIYFGIESAAPDSTVVQKVRQLRILPERIDWTGRFRQVAMWCRDAGIRVGTSLQFGLGETEEQRVQTMDLIADLHREGCIPDGCVALNINSPYPGTQQWITMLRTGAEMPDYRNKLDRHPAFETAHQYSSVTGAEADELYRLAIRKLGAAVHMET